MQQEEYEKIKMSMLERHKRELFKLARTFALSNNRVNNGDIVVAANDIIKVDGMRVGSGMFSEKPICIYSGFNLTKKLVPFKNKRTGTVYQSDIRKVLDADGKEKTFKK